MPYQSTTSRPNELPATPPDNNNSHMDNIFDKLDCLKQNIMKSELPILKLKRISIGMYILLYIFND